MKPFEAITTVYSYYLPEVRAVITELTQEYPHEVFLRSIAPGLDDFHEPIIVKLVEAHRTDVPGLAGFPFRYPTSGSEEGIREYMTLLQGKGVKQVYFWEGDYEGYREVAQTRSIEAVAVPYEADPMALAPSYWFLSNPSARDGMLVPEEKIQAVLEAGHKVFYDLSYLGATLPHRYAIDHPNIDAVVASFSKPYGLFYYRIGFTFSREPIPTLYANKWFKNVYSLVVAERVLDEIDLPTLAVKYKGFQAEIVAQVNQIHGLKMQASDAYLLARLPAVVAQELPEERRTMLARFQRGDGYRFCLTPYFLRHEKHGSGMGDAIRAGPR